MTGWYFIQLNLWLDEAIISELRSNVRIYRGGDGLLLVARF